MPEEDLHLPGGVRFQAHVRFASLTSTLRFFLPSWLMSRRSRAHSLDGPAFPGRGFRPPPAIHIGPLPGSFESSEFLFTHGCVLFSYEEMTISG